MRSKVPTAAEIQDSFDRQLAAARAADAVSFVDEATKAVILIDPVTREPRPFGLWLRTLRLQRRAIEARWWRRLSRAIARIIGRPLRLPPLPPDAQRDFAEIWSGPYGGEGELGCDSPHKNFTITGDKEHD